MGAGAFGGDAVFGSRTDVENLKPVFDAASIIFLDASVRWLLSKHIDLALAATNLLDESYYRYTSFSSLSEFLYSFNIRPRNIIIKMQIKI